MTRSELIAGLDLLVEIISANEWNLPSSHKVSTLSPSEWAYVRGVGSSAVLRMRDELAKFGVDRRDDGSVATYGGVPNAEAKG